MTAPVGAAETPARRWVPLRPFVDDTHNASHFAYSLGVQCGNVVWLAGQIARTPDGRIKGVGDPEAQARQVYRNIEAVLAEAGATLRDVVATTTYITDRAYREMATAVRREFFPGPDYPANTLIICAGLGLPEYLVEVDGIAVIGPRP